MRWARVCAERLFGRPAEADGEETVHQLTSVLQQTSEDDAVKSALIDAVRTLTGARGVRWVHDPTLPIVPGVGERDLLLRAGQQCCGRLVLETVESGPAEWSPLTRRRLETICTLAAYALRRSVERDQSARSARQEAADATPDNQYEAVTGIAPEDRGRKAREFSTPVLQDATFLGAVLPFAMSQARRHGEPLTLLCVAVDRLNGIRELLGTEVSNRAVQNVGTHLAAQLRSSDIVSRIDDDRIIVVLPRARIQGAMYVAQKICRSVETTPSLLPELPCLTVSIGVAECPASADCIDTLLGAADAALGQAKAQGRNRAVAAQIRQAPDRLDRPCLAG